MNVTVAPAVVDTVRIVVVLHFASLLELEVKGPGTYLLEPVDKENCENSKLAHGSSNKVNTEMLSENIVLRFGDVTR